MQPHSSRKLFMTTADPNLHFRRSEVSERQIDTLIGLCKGVVADGVVNQSEAEFLEAWLVANEATINSNPVAQPLYERVSEMLSDSILDENEAAELLETLRRFSNSDGLVDGELIQTTGLPLDSPPPRIEFHNSNFVFTGTFATGNRPFCLEATRLLGGVCLGTVRKDLDYLVLGRYVTPSWKHETFGNKITDALSLMLPIISEEHWTQAMPGSPSHAGPSRCRPTALS